MIIETHGDTTESTAELLQALVLAGKADLFADEIHGRGVSWHAICQFENDMVAFAGRNRWCGATDDWLIVAGQVNAEGRSDFIEDVPEYVGWTCGGLPVQAWLQHGDTCVIVERGAGVYLLPLEDFEEKFEPLVLVEAELADDSAIGMNAAFKLIRTIDATQQAVVLESLEKIWEAK